MPSNRPVPIPLSQGLVTARDPFLLEQGELSRADDVYYRPNDPAPRSVSGRTIFNSVSEGAAIKGLRYLEFEGASDILVDHVGTAYNYAVAAATGTFASLDSTLTGGSTLDSVHYNNKHYLLNGVDRNRVIDSTITSGFHGMLAATTAPTLHTTSGVGTGFTLDAASTITYWIEERVKSGSTVLKRSASTSVECVTLTGDGVTTYKPVITRPTTVNSDATHWALFATATNGAFPNGAEISEVAIGTATIEDTRTGANPVIPSGADYETVSITIAGVTQNVAKNGPPPIASTGDVMEDSLLLNDSTDATRIVYSEIDSPHVFPAVNFIRFETKEADEVKCIRSIGRSAIILMRDSLWRIDTLPRAADSSFQIERIKEQIHGAHGCVGPMAATVFSYGDGLRVAYVSHNGICVTDGSGWDILTDDIDWEATIEPSRLENAVLINDPRRFLLAFYYTPLGGTVNTKAIYLHYHPSHAKSGAGGGFRAKVTGPITVSARCATNANVSGVQEVFTGQADGVVYREWSGFTDAAGTGIHMRIDTPNIYIGSLGSAVQVNRAWVHHNASEVNATFAMTQLTSGHSEDTAERGIDSLDMARNEATAVYLQAHTEGIRLSLSCSNPPAALAINAFALDITDLRDTHV